MASRIQSVIQVIIGFFPCFSSGAVELKEEVSNSTDFLARERSGCLEILEPIQQPERLVNRELRQMFPVLFGD